MYQREIDLNAPDFIFNPYPLLSELRHATPIFYEPRWQKLFFTRYEDIAFLLRDKRLGRSITHLLSRDELGWPPPNPRLQLFDHFQSNIIMDRDPPDHTRLRVPRRRRSPQPRSSVSDRQSRSWWGGRSASRSRSVDSCPPASSVVTEGSRSISRLSLRATCPGYARTTSG